MYCQSWSVYSGCEEKRRKEKRIAVNRDTYVDELELEKQLNTWLILAVVDTDGHAIEVVRTNGDLRCKNA